MPQDALLVAYENLLHDIKTPMALLYTSLQQAENNLDMDQHAIEYIQEAQKKWYMIVKLLNDTSDHVKMNKGILVPHFKNYDMPHLIKSIVEGTKTLANRKNIAISFESTIPHKLMAVDKLIIERILLNLLSNAVKFTGRGGVIRVLLANKGDEVTLTVQDNGPGFAATLLDKITDRYIRDESKANQYGKGLGLSIVKELTELLGGRLCLESTTQGTVADVYLPVFITEHGYEEMYIDDFYSDKIVQIELSEQYM